MKSDDQLRREFRERHAFMATRYKRLLFLLPFIIAATVYLTDGIDKHWTKNFALAVIFIICGLTVWFNRTHGRLCCPKCQAPQRIRGFSFDIHEMRSCVGCGFLLVPEAPLTDVTTPAFYQHKIRWGFTLVIMAVGAGVSYLGYKDYIAHGIETGIFVALFGILPYFGFFRFYRTCPKCEHISDNYGSYCNHCGEMF